MKKTHVLWACLMACFFIGLFTGCPGQVTPQNTVTVTFNDYGSIKTVNVVPGDTVKTPSDPSRSYNYFMYWSKSKASQAEANEFDFSTPITENITLYSIYTPKLNSIKSVTSTQIEIVLDDTSVFPLEDGSYAGLKLQHSTDDENYQDLSLGIPLKFEDKSSYRYLTYSFDTPLSEGTHYFKISNGYETKKSDAFKYIRPENLAVITFLKADSSTYVTREVRKGDVISSSDVPSGPTDTYNYFMYWSESRATKESAVEYDFTTPVMDNKTLYAIYTPKLYSSIYTAFESISSTQIEIKLYNSKVFSLEDGSYAGLEFQYSTDNVNYQALDVISIPSDYRDTATYRILTYSFANNFVLPDGQYYFKVSNGKQNATSSRTTISVPAAVTDLNAVVDDSYAKISFVTASSSSSYIVSAYENATEVASKTISIISSGSTGSVEFFGLKNGTEYTFKVNTKGTDFTVETTATPVITQTETDWLFVMYMDGDNNLNDPIYLDLNETEKGLAENSNRNNIKIVALWDGWDFESGNKDDETSFFDQTPSSFKIEREATLLLELGADSNTLYGSDGSVYWKGCELSSITKNLSYTAPWIVSKASIDTPISGGEVNMGDVQTLTNYLKWVNAHYKANKGIILQFSNHGGGPRSVNLKDNFGRRSMCWDETSGSDCFLKTSDVSKSLKEAGFGTDNKVKMIMEDVCLGGSLEEAYELKDYAEYYIGSPNTIPGMGFDYIAFVNSLTSTATIEEIGGKLIKSYKNDYTWTTSDWNKFFTENPNLNGSGVSGLLKSVYNPSLSTLSFIDLSKIEAVKTAVEEYATLVKAASDDDELVKVGTDGKYYEVGQSQTIPENATFVPITEAVKYHTAYYGDPLYYNGTFGSLKDLGFMAFYLNALYAQTSNTTWINILEKANAIKDALNNAIIACWRDGYGGPTYYKNPQDEANSEENDSYYGNSLGLGLTINCSCWVPHTRADGKDYLYEEFVDWYRNELAFGKDCSAWTNLIEEWFAK